jgi:hypothetical protein
MHPQFGRAGMMQLQASPLLAHAKYAAEVANSNIEADLSRPPADLPKGHELQGDTASQNGYLRLMQGQFPEAFGHLRVFCLWAEYHPDSGG